MERTNALISKKKNKKDSELRLSAAETQAWLQEDFIVSESKTCTCALSDVTS